MRLTIARVNARLLPHGVEIVKGRGYFYFAAVREDAREWLIPSVMTTRLNALSLSQWIDHVESHLT